MRTKLLTLSCEQTINKKVKYFLTQQADIGLHGSQFGGSARIRVSRRTASMLLGWTNVDRVGSAEFLASVTVARP